MLSHWKLVRLHFSNVSSFSFGCLVKFLFPANNIYYIKCNCIHIIAVVENVRLNCVRNSQTVFVKIRFSFLFDLRFLFIFQLDWLKILSSKFVCYIFLSANALHFSQHFENSTLLSNRNYWDSLSRNKYKLFIAHSWNISSIDLFLYLWLSDCV